MAKRKTVEAAEALPVASTPVATEPKKTARKSAAKSKSATGSAAHKHHTKPSIESSEEVLPLAIRHEDIAVLAYSYWEARGRQDGFAEQDWLRAESELLKLA